MGTSYPSDIVGQIQESVQWALAQGIQASTANYGVSYDRKEQAWKAVAERVSPLGMVLLHRQPPEPCMVGYFKGRLSELLGVDNDWIDGFVVGVDWDEEPPFVDSGSAFAQGFAAGQAIQSWLSEEVMA